MRGSLIPARAPSVDTPEAAEKNPPPPKHHEASKSNAPHRKSVGIAAAVVALAVVGAWIYLGLDRGQASVSASGGVQTAVAMREDFVKLVRLAGSTEAVRSRSVLAPRLAGAQLNTMVVTRLAAAGTHVHKNDLLVEFDRQAQLTDYLDKKATYQDLVDQVEEQRAAEDAARAKDETELSQARDDLKKAQLEMQKNEIISRIDAEKNQETLSEAQATLKQLEHTYELKRQAAAAGIKTLEIQRDRAKETMLYAQSNAQKMSIHSPMDGIVVLNSVWLGGRMGEVQEGDEVRPGVSFLKVVDPSKMQVRVEVNQADLLNLRIGQRARVSLDAYPGLSFAGALEELAPLGHASEYSDTVRTFTALFTIHGSDPRLMPDLSAAVDVELDSRKNALVVPTQSVHREQNGNYVWLMTNSGFEKRTVEFGPSNGQDTVIVSGLKANDVVRMGSGENQEPSSEGPLR